MHSVTFGDKNSYDEWRIVPTSRPVIAPPAVKKKTLEIPGANGVLDISSSLTGFPVFENRTGSIEFVVLNDWDYDGVAEAAEDVETGETAIYDHYKYDRFKWVDEEHEINDWYEALKTIRVGDEFIVGLNVKLSKKPAWATGYHWEHIYHEMLGYLHGEEMTLTLEDEPGYFYTGRMSINDWKSDKDHSKIVVNYDLQPYRFANLASVDNWLWDPFNFEKDYISTTIFADKVINGSLSVYFEADLWGDAPVMPELLITNNSSTVPITVTMRVPGDDFSDNAKVITKSFLKTGSYKIYEATIYKNSVQYTFSGNGIVSIKFYRGYL